MTSRKNDDDVPPVVFARRPWTDEEIEALHRFAQERIWMEQFRKRFWRGMLFVFGFPAAFLAVWEPVERLWKLFVSFLHK